MNNQMKPVTFTQAEANAAMMSLWARSDEFKEMLIEAAAKGDAARVIEISKIMALLESANDKLLKAGATMDWIL